MKCRTMKLQHSAQWRTYGSGVVGVRVVLLFVVHHFCLSGLRNTKDGDSPLGIWRSVVGFGYALGKVLKAEIGRTAGWVLASVRFVVLSQRQSRKCSCSRCQQEHLDVPCRGIQKGRLLRPSGSGDVWLCLVVLPEREKYKIEKKKK